MKSIANPLLEPTRREHWYPRGARATYVHQLCLLTKCETEKTRDAGANWGGEARILQNMYVLQHFRRQGVG